MAAALEAIICKNKNTNCDHWSLFLMFAFSNYCLIYDTASLVGHHGDDGVAAVHPVPGPIDGASLYLTDGTWSSCCLSVSVPLPAKLGHCVSTTILHICIADLPANKFLYSGDMSTLFCWMQPPYTAILKLQSSLSLTKAFTGNTNKSGSVPPLLPENNLVLM